MSLSQYNILQAASPNELADLVNAAITAGQQPLGNLLAFPESNSRLYYQAVASGSADGTLPPGAVAVSDGDTVPYVSFDESNSGAATAVVQDDQVGIKLPAVVGLLTEGALVAIVNSAGGDSHNASANVANGAVTNLQLAATIAMVDSNDVVAVVNSASGDSHNGTATITAGALTNVKLAATVALVDNADVVVVHNSAGAAVAGSHTAEVAAGVLTDVKLASTVAPIVNGQALTGVAPTGAYTNTVNFTVTNGVVTAIVLS